MGKLIPVILAVIGLGVGGGAGYVLRPAPEEAEISLVEEVEVEKPGPDQQAAFVKINNQFVIPVVKEDKVKSLVVLSITLETSPDQTEFLYNREPKLRDAFLRVMFDYAYSGGFSQDFTASPMLDTLGDALLEATKAVTGDAISDVLITDIVRQDN